MLEIGNRLRSIRVSRGLNTSVAYEIRQQFNVKIDPNYLARIERGQARVPITTLKALANYYNVSLSSIVTTDDDSKNSGKEKSIYSDVHISEGIAALVQIIGLDKARAFLRNSLKQALNLIDDSQEYHTKRKS